MVQAVGETGRNTLHIGRCVVLTRYSAFWEMDFFTYIIGSGWAILWGGGVGEWGQSKSLSPVDKIYLFMKMRKQKNINQRLIEKYCRIRGKNHYLKVSERYKILLISEKKRKFQKMTCHSPQIQNTMAGSWSSGKNMQWEVNHLPISFRSWGLGSGALIPELKCGQPIEYSFLNHFIVRIYNNCYSFQILGTNCLLILDVNFVMG